MKTKLLLISLVAFMASCSTGKMKYDASGIFETTEVTISSQANGELLRFDVELGDELVQGQVVGYIDTVQLHLKGAQLKGSLGAVGSRRYDIATQIAGTMEQITTQKREKARFEKLVHTDAATQKQLDDIIAQLLVLEKQLTAQKQTLENSNRGISGESTAISYQIAQIDDQIKKSIITSPINGTVLSKYAEPGELATQGRSLFKIADVKTMKLRAYITADQINGLKIGQKVKVYADQGVDNYKEYQGSVIWIADKAEFTPKTIQTRDERANLVYAIQVAVANDGLIKKGMYGEVKFN